MTYSHRYRRIPRSRSYWSRHHHKKQRCSPCHTLDPLTAPFNINAAATGITNCTATNLATGVDVSDAICPLAGLMGGDNPLPFPGDPFMRTFPPIAVGASTFALGAGPADPTGWYLSNPPALAGNGTQWVGLSGVLQ